MPNYCKNTLKITCLVPDIMYNIMNMIFAPDEDGMPIITMGKLLPMPSGYSTSDGYNDIGYHWCNSVWGTKWDVLESWHKIDGHTLKLKYETAWGPNIPWVRTICKILNYKYYFEDIDQQHLSIEHHYWEWGMNFGGCLFWNLGEETHHEEYELEKYAYLYDKRLYKWLIEDMRCKPYNPEWEKFNLLLEKFANPNPENDLL